MLTKTHFSTDKGYDYEAITPLTGYNPSQLTFSGLNLTEFNPSQVTIDTKTLYDTVKGITPVAYRIYMSLLTRLERNDLPCVASIADLKSEFNHLKKSTKVFLAMKELESVRLVFRTKGKYNDFYINPLFAWTGDRRQYFDESTLPLIPDED